MYCDTHCHLGHIEERGENLAVLLRTMDDEGFPFVMDIGTRAGDLARRMERVRNAWGGGIPPWLHFSCGLWPDAELIADRHEAMKRLAEDVDLMLGSCRNGTDNDGAAIRPAVSGTSSLRGFAAVGECGLDRHWNGPSAVAAQAGEGGETGSMDTEGEEELFAMQMELAKDRALPVIIHSRDAFDETQSIIRNSGYDRGVIHCFAYGRQEARAFLDRGWYISFPGNITWGKRADDRDRIASLVHYVPKDRLLLETDAPYLTPAPHRGKTNTPLLIRHTYEHAAGILGMETAALASLVHANAALLFGLTEGLC